MVLRVCGELPTLEIIHGARGWGGVGCSGVGWGRVERGGVGWGGVRRGAVSYQRLRWMVLRGCGELPMLKTSGVKSVL